MVRRQSQPLRSALTLQSLLILTAGCFVLPPASPASAQGTAPPAACRQIRATLLQKYVAYGRHDAKGYLALYAPDYVEILLTGKPYTYASFRKSILQTFAKPVVPADRPLWVEYRIQHCVLTGGNATVDALITTEFPTYRPRTSEIAYYSRNDSHVTDLWQKTAHGWVIKHRKMIHSRTERPKQVSPGLTMERGSP